RRLAVARAPSRAPLLAQLRELRAQSLDAHRQHAPVELELGLAGAAAHADAAALALQVRPAAHEPRRQVLEAGQLDLQLPFVALRALREDLEDQLGAVDDRDVPALLQVALLDR